MRRIFLPMALAACTLTTACTSQQLYATGRNAQRSECMKQPDAGQRNRCLKDAGLSHDAYQREAGNARSDARGDAR